MRPPLSMPLRRLLQAFVISLALAGLALLLLPRQPDLAVRPGRDQPYYSLPFGPEPFAPGELRTTDGALVNWRGVPSARACAECHPREFEEWSGSIHAISDKDLIYDSTVRENTQASLAAGRHGLEKGRWCESCHNPLGTLTGLLTPTPATPEIETLEEGTSCIVCHTAVHAEPLAGNAALTVRMNDVARHLHPVQIMAAPSRHARDMQARRHSPLIGSSALCGACHTEIRPPSVSGDTPMTFQETYDEWRRSPQARDGVQCQDCHMARDPAAYVAALKRGERPRREVSHRIAGGNYLLSMPSLPPELLRGLRGGAPAGLNRELTAEAFKRSLARTHADVNGLLREAAELHTEATREQGRLRIRSTVRNVGAGHALPTGPLDQRHMWLEVRVSTADGHELFHQGALDPATGQLDPAAVRWVKLMLGADGRPDLRHILFDVDRLVYPRKPIPAGAADSADFQVDLPRGGGAALQIEVKLWYRLAFQEILENIERQGLGPVKAIIPPVLLATTTTRLAAGDPP